MKNQQENNDSKKATPVMKRLAREVTLDELKLAGSGGCTTISNIIDWDTDVQPPK